jgi:hypothetical protein
MTMNDPKMVNVNDAMQQFLNNRRAQDKAGIEQMEVALEALAEGRRRAAAVRCGAIGSIRKAIRELRRLNDGDEDFDDAVAVRFLAAAVRTLRGRG